MCVQVVQHHRNPLGCRVAPIGKLAHGFGPIGSGAPLRHPDLAPARERLGKQKQIRHTMSLVLVILALRLARCNGQRNPRFAHELFAGLIHTEDRMGRIQGALIDRQHIFHGGDKLGTVLGRNRPILLQVRLQLVF